MRHSKFFVFLLCCIAIGNAQYSPAGPDGQMPVDSSDMIADIIIKSPVPVIVDFTATWCMPCKILSPTIEELKKNYAGKIKIVKVDIDRNRKLADYFRVSSIPAVFFIKDKSVVLFLLGLREKSAYEQGIMELLKKPQHQDKDSSGLATPSKSKE